MSDTQSNEDNQARLYELAIIERHINEMVERIREPNKAIRLEGFNYALRIIKNRREVLNRYE